MIFNCLPNLEQLQFLSTDYLFKALRQEDIDNTQFVTYDLGVMNNNKNITNIRWVPQGDFCGYTLMSADHGALAPSRDVSNMLLS